MAKLEVYRAKRDFSVTPEPAPDRPRKRDSAKLSFVVHKHHARRLHYDVRLEIEGALASWAVPKGPSYDPSEKRLAVETEDHPLAYGGFEGRIPDGEYGAGDSILWDRGTWDTDPPGQAVAQRKKGHVVAHLQGEKLRGRWHLVRTRPTGGKPAWLMMKAKDETADPAYDVVAERPESVVSGRSATRGPVSAKTLKAAHPDPIELMLRVWPPMLATLSTEEQVGPQHRLEVKYDGFRALAALSGGQLALQSRNGLDLSSRFPAVPKALREVVVGEVVLDGEIVVEERGSSSFQALQGDAAGLRYRVFDLLWHEGEDVRGEELERRRELLESLLASAPDLVQLAEEVEGPIRKAMERARAAGWEGVVAKQRGSSYQGRRSRDWLKVKVGAGQELAVVGFTPLSTGGAGIGALLLAVREADGFRFAGKVGTGYTDELRQRLERELSPDRVPKPAVTPAPRVRDAVWVRPRLVAEVSFTEWTSDGKLRHPSFKGLRPDKKPEDCVKEAPGEVTKAGARSRKGAARR